MNWYENLEKSAQIDLQPIDSKPRELRFRGSMIFEVRVPDGMNPDIDTERANQASNELLTRVQRAVGDEVLFIDEQSLTRI